MDVRIVISGDKDTIQRLSRFKVALMDFSGAMKEIGHQLGDGDEGYFPGQVFASQGGVLGYNWPTDTMSTMLAKRRSQGSANATTTLIRTGVMRSAFEYKADKNSVEISNPTPYFVYHQSTEPRTKMPYRPMMGITDGVKSIVTKVLEDDIKAKVDSF